MATPLQGTDSAANALQRVAYSHDALIDTMLANPFATQGELAKMFGYTQAWISRIMNSDAFNARLAERKTELVDPTITASIEEGLRALASVSLDVVLNKLTVTKDTNLAMKAMEVTTKALGYGMRPAGAAVSVQNSFVVALPTQVPKAEDWVAEYNPQAPQAPGTLTVEEADQESAV